MYSRPLFLSFIFLLVFAASAQVQKVNLLTIVPDSNQSQHRIAFEISMGGALREGLVIRFSENTMVALSGIENSGNNQWLKQAAGPSGLAEAWHWQFRDSALTIWFPSMPAGSEYQIRLFTVVSGLVKNLNNQQVSFRSFSSEEQRLNALLPEEQRIEINTAQPTQN